MRMTKSWKNCESLISPNCMRQILWNSKIEYINVTIFIMIETTADS